MGSDFAVEKMTATPEDGTQRTWMEHWLVTRSDAQAERKQKTWLNHLQRAEAKLASLKANLL